MRLNGRLIKAHKRDVDQVNCIVPVIVRTEGSDAIAYKRKKVIDKKSFVMVLIEHLHDQLVLFGQCDLAVGTGERASGSSEGTPSVGLFLIKRKSSRYGTVTRYPESDYTGQEFRMGIEVGAGGGFGRIHSNRCLGSEEREGRLLRECGCKRRQ